MGIMSLTKFGMIHVSGHYKKDRDLGYDPSTGNVKMGFINLPATPAATPNHRRSVECTVVSDVDPPREMTKELRIRFDESVWKQGRNASFVLDIDLVEHTPFMHMDFVRRVGKKMADHLIKITMDVAAKVEKDLLHTITAAEILAVTDPTIVGVAIEAFVMRLMQDMLSMPNFGVGTNGFTIENPCEKAVCSLARAKAFDGGVQWGEDHTKVVAIEIKSGFGDNPFPLNKHRPESRVVVRIEKKIVIDLEKYNGQTVVYKLILFATTNADRFPNEKCK